MPSDFVSRSCTASDELDAVQSKATAYWLTDFKKTAGKGRLVSCNSVHVLKIAEKDLELRGHRRYPGTTANRAFTTFAIGNIIRELESLIAAEKKPVILYKHRLSPEPSAMVTSPVRTTGFSPGGGWIALPGRISAA